MFHFTRSVSNPYHIIVRHFLALHCLDSHDKSQSYRSILSYISFPFAHNFFPCAHFVFFVALSLSLYLSISRLVTNKSIDDFVFSAHNQLCLDAHILYGIFRMVPLPLLFSCVHDQQVSLCVLAFFFLLSCTYKSVHIHPFATSSFVPKTNGAWIHRPIAVVFGYSFSPSIYII